MTAAYSRLRKGKNPRRSETPKQIRNSERIAALEQELHKTRATLAAEKQGYEDFRQVAYQQAEQWDKANAASMAKIDELLGQLNVALNARDEASAVAAAAEQSEHLARSLLNTAIAEKERDMLSLTPGGPEFEGYYLKCLMWVRKRLAACAAAEQRAPHAPTPEQVKAIGILFTYINDRHLDAEDKPAYEQVRRYLVALRGGEALP